MSEYCVFLDEGDFSFTNSKNGKLLSHKLPGLSFVLFYTNGCKYCKIMAETFKKLPSLYKGIKFCMFNLTNKLNFIQTVKKETITPIDYVPYMMVYVNGIPYVQYTGEYDVNKCLAFLSNVEKAIHDSKMKSRMTSSLVKKEPVKEEKKRHPCTLGIPICGDGKRDNVCFVTMKEAYNDDK